MTNPAPARRRGFGYVVLAVALVAVVAWWAPWRDDSGAAAASVSHCQGEGDVEACVAEELGRLVREKGQSAAVAALQEAVTWPELAGRDHALAHELGHLAYHHTHDAPAVLAACPQDMGSGCLHGVVEAYLDAVGAEADIVSLCNAVGAPGSARVHQCWHGVGHGFGMALDGWSAASARCLAVTAFEDEVACHSGVFMQNALDAQDPHAHFGGPLAEGGGRWDRADLRYPCGRLTIKEQLVGCWQVQPSLVLALTNGSWSRAFGICGDASGYALACEVGIGQQSATQARAQSIDASPFLGCTAASNSTAQGHCIRGALMEVLNHDRDPPAAVRLCMALAGYDQVQCFVGLGLVHPGIQPDAFVRLETCDNVPRDLRETCAGTTRL